MSFCTVCGQHSSAECSVCVKREVADLRAKLAACGQEAADYHAEIGRMNAKLVAADSERDALVVAVDRRIFSTLARPLPKTMAERLESFDRGMDALVQSHARRKANRDEERARAEAWKASALKQETRAEAAEAKLAACEKERDDLREVAAMRDYGNAHPAPFTAVANRAVKAEAEAARLRSALDTLVDHVATMRSYLGHQDQDADHTWMADKMRLHLDAARAALAQRGGET